MRHGALADQIGAIGSDVPESPSLQGWIMISTTWLAVAAAAVMTPVAPQMATHFAAQPGAGGLVQLGIGLTALCVALFGAPFGFLADRIGRKPVLMGALVPYAICGTAPLVLTTLTHILISRAGVGFSEAAVLAAGMALPGDLFPVPWADNSFSWRCLRLSAQLDLQRWSSHINASPLSLPGLSRQSRTPARRGRSGSRPPASDDKDTVLNQSARTVASMNYTCPGRSARVIETQSPPKPCLPAFQAHPPSVGLAGLVDLLTNVPLDVNPGLCKVISLPMPLDEIVSGHDEIFEIACTVA